jgi:hypothetical protein
MASIINLKDLKIHAAKEAKRIGIKPPKDDISKEDLEEWIIDNLIRYKLDEVIKAGGDLNSNE